MASTIDSLTAVKKRNLCLKFSETALHLWLRAERVGWVGWEGAVSQSHSSSRSRDKTACSGTEKTLITTEVNDPIHFSFLLFYRYFTFYIFTFKTKSL